MIRKVLILNRQEEGKNQTCGLLSLEQENVLNGKLKVFDFDKNDNLKLSVKIGENKLFFDNIKNPENFAFSTIYHDINLPICVALAKSVNGKISILATGHSEADRQNAHELFDDFSGDETLNQIKNLIDQELDADTKEAKDEKPNNSALTIEQKSNENAKANTDNIYSNVMSNSEICLDEKKDLPKNIGNQNAENKNIENENFYQLIKPQIEQLFSTFPHEKTLEEKIDDSQWITIFNADESYVLGQIFSENEPLYICYGIPALSIENAPPKHLQKFCQWLPNNLDDVKGSGYWVMYQDAKTGQNIVMDDLA